MRMGLIARLCWVAQFAIAVADSSACGTKDLRVQDSFEFLQVEVAVKRADLDVEATSHSQNHAKRSCVGNGTALEAINASNDSALSSNISILNSTVSVHLPGNESAPDAAKQELSSELNATGVTLANTTSQEVGSEFNSTVVTVANTTSQEVAATSFNSTAVVNNAQGHSSNGTANGTAAAKEEPLIPVVVNNTPAPTSNETVTSVELNSTSGGNSSRNATAEENETGWCGYTAQYGFLTAYTKAGTDNLLIDLTEGLQANNAVRFLVTAMTVSGTYADGSGYLTEYATPMEETSNTMFELRLGSDNISVDVHRPQLDLRTSDNQMKAALKRGTGTGHFETLGTFRCARRPPPQSFMLKSQSLNFLQRETLMDSPVEHRREDGNVTTRSTDQRVIVSGGAMIRAGFWVTPSLKQATSYRLLGVKVFQQNVDVAVEYLMPDGHAASVGFSLVRLPETPMLSRAADDRLLYFTTDYQDLGEHGQYKDELPEESVNRKISTIWRYNLAQLPDRQIRIHIDPTVPKRWREWFRAGVEAWNEAFSLLDEPKAVRAVLPEDEDWPKDYDISDARFSTISWTITQAVISMGIAKVDPRSGEILKSDIIMSDGWVRAWLGDLDLLAPNFTSQLRESMGFRYESRLDTTVILGRNRIPGSLSSNNQEWGRKISLLSTATGKPLETSQRDEILGKGLQNVVTHETGHILGLRHNFKGSLGVTYACIRSPSCTAVHGLTASVMDYVPVNLPSAAEPDVQLFSPVLGGYDKLAIKYGYMDLPANSSADNVSTYSRSVLATELRAVLREAEKYETCYDADRISRQDPSCMAYDISSDPLKAYEEDITRLAEVQRHLLNTSVMPGAPYTHYGDAVDQVLLIARNTGVKLVDWLGGVSNSYVHRRMDGTDASKMARTPVSAHVQRRALALLFRIIRPRKAGLLPPPESLPYLVSSSSGTGSVESLDLDTRVRSIARTLISAALSTEHLARMWAQERLDEGLDRAGLTCGEFLSKFVNSILLDGLSNPAPAEWDLQRFLIQGLSDLHEATSLPDSVRAHALHHLLRIYSAVGTSMESAETVNEVEEDGPSETALLRAHLSSLQRQVASAVCGDSTGRPCTALLSQSGTAARGIAGAALISLAALLHAAS